MTDLAENAEIALRIARDASVFSYDTEGTGLDWRVNYPVGYVLAVGVSPAQPSGAEIGAPEASAIGTAPRSVYVPVRHGGGGNLPGCRPMTSPTEGYEQHPFEVELAKVIKGRDRTHPFGRIVGHHMKFDVHFSANTGVLLGRRLACTQNMAAILDEYAKHFSLEECANRMGVTAKLGEELYKHIAQMFGGPPVRASMQHFWRLAGNDPLGMAYSEGDGTTTLELYHAQLKQIAEEELQVVCDLENDLIWSVFRSERRGIRVDLKVAAELRLATEDRITDILRNFPMGFNPRSPKSMLEVMVANGHTDYPTTSLGNPSFTEKWLKFNAGDLGKMVIELRQAKNLIASFIEPLEKEHVFKGRVHATLNQLKSDDSGTISGRFSCSSPNLQQVPKRVKELAKPFRKLFIADPGWIFWERDYSQCFVAGTKVTVPSGTRNIEDMKAGDLVYSYDANCRLVLRKVTWAGQTGTRLVKRVLWATNGRTYGHLDCTANHRIRRTDGSYVTVEELQAQRFKNRKTANALWVPVLALRKGIVTDPRSGYESVWLHPTGAKRMKESRFVFSEVNGWHPEEVHHEDHNSLNNEPLNLIGLTGLEHQKQHMAYGMSHLTPEERLARSRKATEGLREKIKLAKDGSAKGNHAIIDIEDLGGEEVPVYDITVEDTHNFIANEICVHNCEPRLFAHYSQDPNLLRNYNATPFVDVHTTTAELLGVERDPTAKRMNMGIFTGMQIKSFAGHMGWDEKRAGDAFNKWFAAFPSIKKFQNNAKQRLLNRGFVFTLLGRKCRLESQRFAYRGTSKIIQGGNADIIKYKYLEVDRICEDNNDIVHICMTVHDSFNGQRQDTPEAKALFERIERVFVDVQGAPFNLSVPFVMDGHEGANWSIATFGDK